MSSGDEQYGGWCTNWAAYDVPTLWKMIENEGRTESYEQAGSWDRTSGAGGGTPSGAGGRWAHPPTDDSGPAGLRPAG